MAKLKMPCMFSTPMVGKGFNAPAILNINELLNVLDQINRIPILMPKPGKRARATEPVAIATKGEIPFSKLTPRMQAQKIDRDAALTRMRLSDLKNRIQAAKMAGRIAEAKKLEFQLREQVSEFNLSTSKIAPFVRKHLHKMSWGAKPYSANLY